MTLLVRDEVDIVRQNIEFHLARGVDHIIATDNGSTDGTRDILAEFERLGVMSVLDEPEHVFRQGKWVTRMALMAREELSADWILNCDADEFWWVPGGELKAELAATDADALSCQRHNMVYPHDDEWSGPWQHRAIYRYAARSRKPAVKAPYTFPLQDPCYYRALSPKVMVRAERLQSIGEGNHSARHANGSRVRPGSVIVHHFPVRSAEQFRRKIAQGGAAIGRNTELEVTVGRHWRHLYRELSEGRLEAALADALPSAKRLRADLASGKMTRDLRIQASLAENGAPPPRRPAGYDLRFNLGRGMRMLGLA